MVSVRPLFCACGTCSCEQALIYHQVVPKTMVRSEQNRRASSSWPVSNANVPALLIAAEEQT